VDLSHAGSRKQLRKKASHKRKAANAQSGLSAPASKRARITTEDTPHEQPSGLSASSSMISIESLIRKVRAAHSIDRVMQIYFNNLACMCSRRENETRFTISTSLSPRTHKDKSVTRVTNTINATMGIAKLSR
jgi:hypothetical protein